MLNDPDAAKRAEGLAAAGYFQVVAFYDKVLDAALHRQGVERQAAIYALGFYSRDIETTTLRRLLTSKDEQVRFSAIELATRKDPARFARESMDVVRSSVQSQPSESSGEDPGSNVAYLPRILCRLTRGALPEPLLEGLEDSDPEVRRISILALELGGNPDAIGPLERLTRHPDPHTREASLAALRSLGPAGR